MIKQRSRHRPLPLVLTVYLYANAMPLGILDADEPFFTF
jgi:hypothetical protein